MSGETKRPCAWCGFDHWPAGAGRPYVQAPQPGESERPASSMEEFYATRQRVVVLEARVRQLEDALRDTLDLFREDRFYSSEIRRDRLAAARRVLEP